MKHVKELAEIIVEQGKVIDELGRDFSIVIKQRDDSLRDLKSASEKFHEAEQSIARLQESNNALAAENNKRQEREQSLVSGNESLRQLNAELTNRFQALQQGSVDLSNRVAGLEAENAVLADQEAVLQLQNNDIRDEIKAHVITADNLRDRIANAVEYLRLTDLAPTSDSIANAINILQPKAPQ